MNRLSRIALLCVLFLLVATPAVAQQAGAAEGPAPERSFIYMGSAFAAGMIIVGAAMGIGKIGATAFESMARQPEVAGTIQIAMIIAAAIIEGATFFGLIVCLARK